MRPSARCRWDHQTTDRASAGVAFKDRIHRLLQDTRGLGRVPRSSTLTHDDRGFRRKSGRCRDDAGSRSRKGDGAGRFDTVMPDAGIHDAVLLRLAGSAMTVGGCLPSSVGCAESARKSAQFSTFEAEDVRRLMVAPGRNVLAVDRDQRRQVGGLGGVPPIRVRTTTSGRVVELAPDLEDYDAVDAGLGAIQVADVVSAAGPTPATSWVELRQRIPQDDREMTTCDFDGLWAAVAGGVGVVLGSALDGVDGELARVSGRASRWGATLDTLLDRYADLAVVLGLVLGAGATESAWAWGFAGACGCLLVSYVHAIGRDTDVRLLFRREFRLLIFAMAAIIGQPLLGLAAVALAANLDVVRGVVLLLRAMRS